MSNNLKEYVVVKSSQGSIDLWTKAVYDRYQNSFIIGDGLGHPYTAITTFNTDQSLTEDKELEQLRQERDRMKLALEWYADPGNYLGDNGQVATAYENDRIANKAAEALKNTEA